MTPIDPLQTAFWLACDALIWRHCAPWELDDALVAWGYGLGPCAAQDLVGLDAVLASRQGAGSPVLRRMVAEGRQGKSAGWGFYRYPGGGGAVVDPLIEDLINEEAWFARMDRADLPVGARVDGPAAITEAETTIIVPSSRVAVCQADGCIDLRAKG